MFRASGGAVAVEESVYFDAGAAAPRADAAGGCPRRGGRVSRPGHLVLRPHRRGARRAVTDRPRPPEGALPHVRRSRAGPARADLRLRQDRPRRPRRRRSSRAASSSLSTGGTAQALRDAGLPVRDVAAGHRVPRDARRPGQDAAPDGARGPARASATIPTTARRSTTNGIAPIDLLVVNLYPFEATVAAGADYDDLHREHRHRRPGDAALGGEEPRASSPSSPTSRTTRRSSPSSTRTGGATSLGFRRALALTAFGRTAAYDAAVSGWMAGALGEATPRRRAASRARSRSRSATARTRTRRRPSTATAAAGPGVATARQLQGKALSYNNINDTDAAFELVAEFDPADGPACAIIKHANPCGVARGATLARRLPRRLRLRPDLGLRRHRRAEPARSTPRPPRRSPRSSPRW